MDILTDIYTWIIGVKCNNKHKTTVLRIKRQVNNIILKITFKYWKPYHNFGHLSFYGTTIYELAYKN